MKKLKRILWKVDGMEFKDNPTNSNGIFHLKYGKQIIGELTYHNRKWSFKYTDEYRKNPFVKPIIDFPDIEKEYVNEQLWPFFATRIPALNQPFQHRKIQRANIKEDDSVALLKLFGNETITNPFKLLAIS